MEPSKSYMDRGWAWVILLASFLSMVIHSLLYYGAGIIHVELLHQFKESDSYTSVASSLYSSLNLFIGNVTRFFLNKRNVIEIDLTERVLFYNSHGFCSCKSGCNMFKTPTMRYKRRKHKFSPGQSFPNGEVVDTFYRCLYSAVINYLGAMQVILDSEHPFSNVGV